MEYPKRHITHVSENKALNILGRTVPKEWIVRELTERDYGVDLYIELTNKGNVTGELVAIQVKGKRQVRFNAAGSSAFSNIKNTTLNYWLGLPVPVFLFVVCLTTEQCYWVNIREENRKGTFSNRGDRFPVPLSKKLCFADNGILAFQFLYMQEKRWRDVESAIEKSLMFFSSLGPFCLFCRRKEDAAHCSTTIQYMLLEHYEYCRLFCRYLTGIKPIPEPVSAWYQKHILATGEGRGAGINFSYKLVKEMLDSFVHNYYENIKFAYKLVVDTQGQYFQKRFPYLFMHLKLRPLVFIEEDWYARYWFDEYENDTRNIEMKFFEDFTEYDGTVDLTKIPH